jgi:hypothetical protein
MQYWSSGPVINYAESLSQARPETQMRAVHLRSSIPKLICDKENINVRHNSSENKIENGNGTIS